MYADLGNNKRINWLVIKDCNHQAEYIPCVAHSLNLVGKYVAECGQSAVRFFMFVQGLHVFYSASTHRWNLFTDALKPLQYPTIKPLSDTVGRRNMMLYLH